MLPPLRGMLHKKHRHARPMLNWSAQFLQLIFRCFQIPLRYQPVLPFRQNTGKRYFEVDDERGILFYFRTRQAQRWDEPAKHFKLSTLL